MVRLNTELCRLLDLDHPIVQAPIGGGASPELIASVADAGALGMLPVTSRNAEETHDAVREVQSRTQRQFAVNIVLAERDTDAPPEEPLTAALEEGIDVVSFSFGDAAPYVERVHDAGAFVMQTVGSAEEAKQAADAGVDIVVAQGWEAGGHVQSEVATMPLVPRVVDAVGDVPVVSAGGIADGRGIAAALSLGAAGAWLGTRFVASKEATNHPEYQNQVLEASETDTEYTELFDVGWPGTPHRVIRNSTVEEWEQAGRPPRGERPGEGDVVGENADGEPKTRYDSRSPSADTTGDIEKMPLYAGQSTGLTDDQPSVATVIDRLVSETVDAIRRVSSVPVDE